MIDIRVMRENDAIRSVVAVGHATKGKKAEQICSGVSTLMYTLALTLRDMKKVGINVIDDDVGMSVDIFRGHTNKEAQVVVGTVVKGLKSLSDLYPHSVRLRSN